MNSPQRKLSPDQAHRLTLEAEPWLSCDDCFDQIDFFAERVVSGGFIGMPALRAHLIGCPACGEEARSLVQLLATDDGVDPAPSLRRLSDG